LSERVPRLTLRFVLWTAAVLTVAATAVFVLVARQLTTQAERAAIARAELTSRAVLATSLRPSDLTAPVSPARRRQLDALFERRVLVGGPVRASLVRRDGMVVYSTEHALIGTSTPRVSVAVVTSSVTRSSLVMTVPLAFHGRVAGELVLEQPYGPLATGARHTAFWLAAVVEALLLLLLAVLAPALGRASARIRRHVDELDRIATHDQLLGLPNRAGVQRRVEALAGRPGSLLVLDLVAFREVNDALGSGWGNLLLSAWAGRVGQARLGAELIGRLGEDELCLLHRAAGEDEVAGLAAEIRSALEAPVEIDGIRIALDTTVGAALIPARGASFDELLRRAGVALNHAKDAGKPLAIFTPELDERDTIHLRRTAELQDALTGGELAVYYQPQADFQTGAIRGVEALIRWIHPEQGLLDAGKFIATAQRSGLITRLDRFVLETMCRQWRDWSSLGIQLEVAANLAPVDVFDAGLPDEIAALIDEYSLDPHHLVLELTEVAMLHDDAGTRDVLTRLRALGVRLAIDDYGTGYSSLAYLRRLPVQQIKLDRSFIDKLPESATDRAIVRSTTELAHALGATVVAEGIETPEQWEAAAGEGCDIAQGYLIARALSPEAMTSRLLRQPRGSSALATAADNPVFSTIS
jgi:diguanylate cyclase (GGDEF)-like protein